MWGEQEFVPDYYPAYPAADPYEMHTGDPRQDIEYERQYQQSTYIVPDIIKSFLTYFQKSISEQNVFEIQNAYENGFNKLTERFFKTSPWPEAEVVAPIVQNDHLFLILYKELFYRHIYARVQNGPTLEQRFESYYNYCNLFNYILNADGPVHLELPNQWLWDIIDEFIYQFQCFSIYRCKVSKKSDDEISFLRSNPKIWNVHSVLNVLHSLVDKSNINKQLEVYSMGGDPDSVAGEFGQHSLYKMLGYFSLVGLLRLHSLLGDYYQALKILECIDFNKKTMYSRVPACQITTFYYVGFGYLMMRRYQDAIRTFSNILLYIQRTKQMFQTRVQMYDQITKMNDKMYTLLAICLVLHPMRIDESVHSQLREKFQDKMLRMQKGDLEEFQNNFSFACPKFLSPVPPNYDAVGGINHKEPFMLQLKVFIDEVSQQIVLPTIRSYLKLYTTLPLSKLAVFMDMINFDPIFNEPGIINKVVILWDMLLSAHLPNLNLATFGCGLLQPQTPKLTSIREDELKTHLMCFKHKMKNVVWTKGTSGLDGEFQSASEVDFYIDKAMIHIADTKVARRYGDFFIRQIHKFEEITRNLKMVKTTG